MFLYNIEYVMISLHNLSDIRVRGLLNVIERFEDNLPAHLPGPLKNVIN